MQSAAMSFLVPAGSAIDPRGGSGTGTVMSDLLLRGAIEDRERGARYAAVLGIVAALNIPLVHFSVYWWRTLHPSGPTPANLASGSGLGGTELAAFFTALVSFTFLFAWLLAMRVRIARLEDKLALAEIRLPQEERVPVAT